MAKLTMFSLDAGRLIATPADPAVVAEPYSSVAAGPDAVASSSSSTTASTARSQVKVEDAALRAFGRRVSPRKLQTAVKYEEVSDDDAAPELAARPPPRRTTLARQLTASKRPLEPSAIASSSKLGEGSPTSSRKPRTDAASSPKKARRSPIKGAAAGDDSAFTLDPPPRWREVYDEIKAMRANIVAPVDGMGCAAAGEREHDPIRSRFAVLVSLMLSSQTKDEMTHRAVEKLRSDLPGGLSAESLLAAPDILVRDCISCVGFANRKTEYIKLAAADCLALHGGDIPRELAGLLALKGVGPKMAYLVLEHAWSDSLGIGVDIHVERITNRLGWHPKPTNKPTPNPEIARRNLENWLPVEFWGPINPLLVGFGQKVCKAVLPRCDLCTLGPKALCPSYDPTAIGRARAKAEKLGRDGVKREEAERNAVGQAGAGPSAQPKVEIGLEGPSLVKMEHAEGD